MVTQEHLVELQQQLDAARAAVAEAEPRVTEAERKHTEASEAYRRASAALDSSLDEKCEAELTSALGKARVARNRAAATLHEVEGREGLPAKVANVARLESALAGATQAYDLEQRRSTLARLVAESRDTLRSAVQTVIATLDEIIAAAQISAGAIGYPAATAQMLLAELQARLATEGLPLERLRLLTRAIEPVRLAFGLFNEKPLYLEHGTVSEAIEMALFGTDPVKVFAGRSSAKVEGAVSAWFVTTEATIAQLDQAVDSEIESSENSRDEKAILRAYRLSQRRKAGEQLTKVEQRWACDPLVQQMGGSAVEYYQTPTTQRLDSLLLLYANETRYRAARTPGSLPDNTLREATPIQPDNRQHSFALRGTL